MTLLVQFSLHKQPVIMGDIFVSRPLKEGQKIKQDVKVPTSPFPNNFTSKYNNNVITSLIQKTIVINENIALGFSGSIVSAQTLAKDIKDQQENLKTVEEFSSYLDEIDFVKPEDVTVFVILIERIGRKAARIAQITWGSGFKEVSHKNIGTIRVSGSGEGDFLRAFRYTGFKTGAVKDVSFERHDRNAHVAMVTFSTHLLGEQLRVGKGIDSYYGGVFEGVSNLGGKLGKLDGVTFLFFQVEFKNLDMEINKIDIEFTTVSPLMKTSYFNDYLIICNFILNEKPDEYFAIKPLLSSESKSEKKEIEDYIEQLDFQHINSPYYGIYIYYPQFEQQHVMAGYTNGKIVNIEKSDKEHSQFEFGEAVSKAIDSSVQNKIEILKANRK